MRTYEDALTRVGVTVPDHLIADADIPVLSGTQAQGDLLVYPTGTPIDVDWSPVGPGGVQVVVGEATGNTHWLHAGMGDAPVLWARRDEDLLIGYLTVPAGQTAFLIHTDEHGANGIAPGTYAISGKREQADEIRRVAD